MTIELESMAVEMPEVEAHPNRAPFRGVLTVVDVASERAPLGSKGHRVLLTKVAAETALASLVGMALDYTPTFDRHDVHRKVGVITSADVVGRNLEVGGYLYAKDFPEVVKEVARAGRRGKTSVIGWQSSGRVTTAEGTERRGENHQTLNFGPQTSELGPRAAETKLRSALMAAVGGIRELGRSMRGAVGQGRMGTLRAEARVPKADKIASVGSTGLGMSFEVSDVTVVDTRAHVWILTHVTFTGAAILRSDKAAYEDTWIELA
jgi:hypothetical protein